MLPKGKMFGVKICSILFSLTIFFILKKAKNQLGFKNLFSNFFKECVQGINFFENNLYLAGNFGEIVRIQFEIKTLMMEQQEDN